MTFSVIDHSPTSATGNRVGAHAVARDTAGGVGGAETVMRKHDRRMGSSSVTLRETRLCEAG